MISLTWKVLVDRWHLLVGTLCAITLGVALVHSGMAIATTVASARPPAGLDQAERAIYLSRLNGTNTLNGIASLLGVFLAVFVVRSTIEFAITERRRELALLRLAGAKRRQVRSMLLGEAFVLGLAGSLLGGAVGMALAGVQRALFIYTGIMPADLTVGWQPAHLLIDLLVGVGVALAGAHAASKRATRISPLDALRHRGVEAGLMTPSRWIIGGIAAVLTLTQLVVSVRVGGFLGPLLFGLGIMMTGSITASQFGPLLVPLAARLTRTLARGPIAELAMAKVRDDARRTAQVAAPLVVLVGLVAGLQGLLDTQTKAGELELATTSRADLRVATHGDPSARIAALPGVASADADVSIPAAVSLVRTSDDTPLPVSVIAVDPQRFAQVHPYRVRAGSLADFGDDSVVLGPGIENGQLTTPVDAVAIQVGGRSLTAKEAARTGEGLAATDGVYVSRRLVPQPVIDGSAATILVRVSPGADIRTVTTAIERLGVGTVTTPQDEAERRNRVKNAENRSVMAALVGVGALYAVISLLSTLAISTTQRRSEFAIDRLTGLTRSQVVRMVIVDTLTTVGIGLALGGAVAVLTLIGLWSATWRSYGSPVIAIPWLLLAAMTIIVATLSTATGVLAARHATNRPTVHDLTTKE